MFIILLKLILNKIFPTSLLTNGGFRFISGGITGKKSIQIVENAENDCRQFVLLKQESIFKGPGRVLRKN
jgi:hypothetical protein